MSLEYREQDTQAPGDNVLMAVHCHVVPSKNFYWLRNAKRRTNEEQKRKFILSKARNKSRHRTLRIVLNEQNGISSNWGLVLFFGVHISWHKVTHQKRSYDTECLPLPRIASPKKGKPSWLPVSRREALFHLLRVRDDAQGAKWQAENRDQRRCAPRSKCLAFEEELTVPLKYLSLFITHCMT